MVSQLEANADNAPAPSGEHDDRPEEKQIQGFEKLEYFYSSPDGTPVPLGNADRLAAAGRLFTIALVSIAALAICAVASYEYSPHGVSIAAKPKQIEEIVADMTKMKARLDAVESGSSSRGGAQEIVDHGDDRNNELRLRGFDTAIAQLTDQFDQFRNDASARDNRITSRLEKLESIVATPTAIATPLPSSAPLPPPDLVLHPAQPSVSNEATGAIDVSRHMLPAFTIRDIQNGVAMISGPAGLRSFSQGDVIPGAGTVQKIERRGHVRIVVTSLGIIKTTSKPHARNGGDVAPGT